MVQIASVDIGTKLDLSGFYQGLGSLSNTKTPSVKLSVKFNEADVNREKTRLQKVLNRDLTIKVRVNDAPLTQLNKHIESKRTHIRDVNAWLEKNPLRIRTTTELINDASFKKQVTGLSQQLEATVKVKAELGHREGEKLKLTFKDGIERGFDVASDKISNVFKTITDSQQKSSSKVSSSNFLPSTISLPPTISQVASTTSSSVSVSSQTTPSKVPSTLERGTVALSTKGDSSGVQKSVSKVGIKKGSIFDSVFVGASENFGRMITSKFSEGLTDSIESALSSKIGSFDLVGRSIFERVIPGIRDAITKAPVVRAIQKGYSESDFAKTIEDSIERVQSAIGKDQIEIEKRLLTGRKRVTKTGRNEAAAKELGIEYEELLSREGLNEVQRKQGESELAGLEIFRNQLERNLADYMAKSVTERGEGYFNNAIQTQKIGLAKIQKQKILTSKKIAAFEQKEVTDGLTEKEQNQKLFAIEDLRALDQKEKASVHILSETQKKFSQFRASTELEQEGMLGSNLDAKVKQLNEVEKQLQTVRERVERLGGEKQKLERLLDLVGVQGAKNLEGARLLRTLAISEKRELVSRQREDLTTKLTKAEKVLEASNNKILKYQEALKNALADSDDDTILAAKALIEKEVLNREELEKLVTNVKSDLDRLNKQELSFIQRAEASVPLAEANVVKSAGSNKNIIEIQKTISTGNVKNIGLEYNRLFAKLRALDFSSNEEMASALQLMDAMNTQVAVYEKQANDALKAIERAGKTKATGKKVKKQPSQYQDIIAEVSAITGFKISPEQIPTLKAFSDEELKNYKKQGIIATGAYSSEDNSLTVTKEVLAQLNKGNATPKNLETLIHELVHGMQSDFGKINLFQELKTARTLLKPTAKDYEIDPKLAQRVETSTSNIKGDPEREAFTRDIEQDAYVFTNRNKEQIIANVQRKGAIRNIGQLAGSGGGKILNVLGKLQVAQYKELIENNKNAFYDTSETGLLLDTKFENLSKIFAPYLEKLKNIDILPQEELDKLYTDLQVLIEKATFRASNFANEIHTELLAGSRKDLLKQLQGVYTSKDELKNIAKTHGVGTSGTKEQIATRLVNNIEFEKLRATVPQLTPEQKNIISKTDQLIKTPDVIKPHLQGRITVARDALSAIKNNEIPQISFEEIQDDYHTVQELLSRDLEDNLKAYLKGAGLQLASVIKNIEDFVLSDIDIGAELLELPKIEEPVIQQISTNLDLSQDLNFNPKQIAKSIEQGTQVVVDDYAKQIDDYDWNSLLAQEAANINLDDIVPETSTGDMDDWDAKFAAIKTPDHKATLNKQTVIKPKLTTELSFNPEQIAKSIEQGTQVVVDDYAKQIDDYDWDSLLAQEIGLGDIELDISTGDTDDWDAKFAQSYGLDNLGTGLSEGIEHSIPNAELASIELAQSITRAAKNELEIQSPSKVFERLGRFVVEGFNKGLNIVKAVPAFPEKIVTSSKQKVEGIVENLKNKNSINKSNKANASAVAAMSHVYSASVNRTTSNINKAVASFDEYEQQQFESVQKYFEEKQIEYQKLLAKAEANIQSGDKLELSQQELESLKVYLNNAKLLDKQELKGNIVNSSPLISPEKINQVTQNAPNKFVNSVGAELANLFGDIAAKVRKQAEVLKMHTPSLISNLVVSANEAELRGDTEESTRLLGYRDKLTVNNNRALELTRKTTLTPDEVTELQSLNIATQDIFKTLNVGVPQLNTFFDVLFKGSEITGTLLQSLKGLVGGFLAFRGVQFFQNIIASIAPASLDAAIALESLERRFLFISNNAQDAANSLAFVKGETARLGTDLQTSLEGYVSLGAATRDTALESQTQKIFSGVSQANTVYDLNSAQQSRVFRAVQQMVGKGKVSAEELRQQLGEVLPGAFNIAARAMGVTTQSLDKMMSQGKLLSEDFLPKFVQQLSAETALGVKGAANSSVSALIKFNNALFELQANIGRSFLPLRNLLLTMGGGVLKFVTENAGFLLGVFSALAVMAGVSLFQSFGTLTTALMKIPGVATAASAAMATFQKILGNGDNKLKATQLVEGLGNTLQNIRANPIQSLKSGATNILSGAKGLGTAILDNMKGGLPVLSSGLINLQKNGISSIGANFTKGAVGIKAFSKAALVNGVAGFIGLATGAKALIAAIAPMLTMFVTIEVGIRVLGGIGTAFKDASGDSRNFADTATESLQKYREALAESRGETQKFAATKLVRDESLLDAMGLGALLPKEIKADANWFDKLRFGTGKAITGLVESPANLLKKLSRGRIGATYEDKKLADNLIATFELSSGVNSTTSEALSLLGTKGQGVRELGQLKQYDDQLRQIQTRRAALVATNPQDKAGLKVIDDEQTKILELREKASKPIGILQANMQANVDMLKKEIEKYQKLAEEPGKNQAQYKNVLAGLQGDLESAQKIQEKFTRAIGESVNAFSLMQKNIQGVTDKLADADDKAVITGNTLKANLYANAKTQGGLQFGLSEIDIKSQEEKIKRLIDTQNQTKALLQNKDAQATLDAYGITENTGRAELKTIAEKAGERANDKYVIEQYSVIQERSLEISNLQAGLAQSKYELNQKLVELNKQITEYYISATRQFTESSLEAQRQTSNLKTQTYATNIRTSISGFQDNIVAQFAESVISSIEQLSEAADKQFDVESAALQANNAFEDSLKQGEELRKQLPGINTTGTIDIPAIPIELDLSKLGIDNSFIDITRAFNESLSSAKDTIEDSADSTNNLTEAFQSVTLGSINFGDSVQQAVDNTDSGTIATQNLATELLNTTFTASDLGFAIDTNTDSLNANNNAVIATNDSLFDSIVATSNVTASTINWGTETGNVHNVIEGGLRVALNSLPVTLQDIIKNTVDWFSTFANNVPILNSIGVIFSSWGQQLSNLSQNVAGFVQGQGAGFSQNALGMGEEKPPVGNANQPVFPIAGITYAQAQAKKSSNWGMRKHPVTGQMKMHRGVDYGFGEGTQIVSPMAGVVTGVKYQAGGAGKYVVVESIDEQGRKIEHKFFHLSSYDVKRGQRVNAGDKIGKVGSTGIGTGAHLHYETWINGKNVNPQEFLAGRNGRGLSAAQKGMIEQHHPGDGHNHGETNKRKANSDKVVSQISGNIPVSTTPTRISTNGGSAPKLGTGYEALNELGGQLAQNKYFNPSTAEGRGRLAIALGIGGSEAFEKNTTRRAFYTYKGGTGNNMQGFGQFNNAYHKEIINTPEKYQNFFGQILAGERRLPNSQKGIGDYGAKVTEAVQSGQIKSGQDLIKWMQANKLGGSNWQGVDDGWKRNPGLADQLVQYLKGGLPIQANSTAANTNNISAPQQIQQIANTPIPTVWTPGSVNTRGNAVINEVTGRAEQQRDRQIELARQKASNEAAQNTATALRNSNKAFLELERGLRENGIKVNSLGNQVTDTNLEYQGALDNEQKRQQEQRKLEEKYSELENNLVEQSRAIQSQVDTAKTLLSKGGIVSPEMRERVQKLIDDPNIKDNLKEQLRTALTTGVLGDDGRNILTRAVSEGEDQLKKLQVGLSSVRSGRAESKKLLDERFAKEEAVRKQQAGFDIENANLDTLRAKLEQLQTLKEQSPFAPEVQSIPALEQVIKSREEQLNLEKQLKEIADKERDKVYTKDEADRLRVEVQARKKIVDATIAQKTEQAKLVLQREQENRNRDAANELAQTELANDKAKVEQLKLLQQTNPLAPELQNNAIGALEQRIALREAELQLAQDLVAIEQLGIEGKRTPDEVSKLKAGKQDEYQKKIENIKAQGEQTAFANQISQEKTLLSIKQQQLDYQKQVSDVTIQAINLGLQQGDPLKLKFEIDKSELAVNVEKQILDMKEFARSTGKTQEEIAALEQQIRGLNTISLGNLEAEFNKAVTARATAITSKLSDSKVELLESQASFYSNRGMTNKARELQRESAILQQQNAYKNQKTELEEFIKTNQVGATEAANLRDNLEQVNQVKFDNIKDNFNAFKPVIDSAQSGLKNFFAGIIKGGQSIGDLFKGLMDSILSSVAELASNFLVEKLFGGILGKGKNEGQGGMFAKGDSEGASSLSPIGNILGDGTDLGTSPITPMFVNVVNGDTFGGLGSGSGLTNIFSGKEDSTNNLLPSLFSGFTGKVDSANPVPVGIIKSNPDALSPITNVLGNVFGGKGGLGSIVSGIGSLFSGGSKGGNGLGNILGSAGSILGIASSLLGGFFWEGGVIGNYAHGGIVEAIAREKSMNGGRGVAIAALTHGERVLNLSQTKNLDKLGGIDILNFSDGGSVGYIPSNTEYGGSADKVTESKSQPRDVNVKLETQVINGVEYLTKSQGEELARKAAEQGAMQGARYVSDKLINSPSYRSTHGL